MVLSRLRTAVHVTAYDIFRVEKFKRKDKLGTEE
jgi:hypothetical protein